MSLRLKRDVVVEVFPVAWSHDPASRDRFPRDAEQLAAVNHPGVAAICGIEEAEGRRCSTSSLAKVLVGL